MKTFKQFLLEDLSFQLISYNNQDQSIVVSINGKKYEWFYNIPVEELYRKAKTMLSKSNGNGGKTLNYLKSKYTRYEKLNELFDNNSYKWTTKNSSTWEAEFKEKNGNEYYVKFDIGQEGTFFGFYSKLYPQNPNAIEVFNIVITILKEFLKYNKTEKLFFFYNDTNNKKFELYKMIAKKFGKEVKRTNYDYWGINLNV